MAARIDYENVAPEAIQAMLKKVVCNEHIQIRRPR